MGKYLVWIERKPTFTGNFIHGHREFLQSLREVQTLITAGGFTDQTGGAYVLQADSIEEASNIVKNDPLNQENESVYTIKEWNAN
jgi:uncharacterized protein YciI